MLIKLADLRWRQIRNRRPVLVGKVGQHWLMIIQRNEVGINGESATAFIGPESETASNNKPLSPVWDAKNAKWIGPGSEDYDTREAIAELVGGAADQEKLP